MIFNTLFESSLKNELILIDGGYCRWHLRKDGQITIHEIIVLPEQQNNGIGTMMLDILKSKKHAKSIFAKCPVNMDSNNWYKLKEFTLIGTEMTKNGTKLNLWKLEII